MPRQPTPMPLAFSASQQLDLPVQDQIDRLPAYLQEEDRVVKALLDPNQLECIEAGRYRYTVTTIQVFQLQVKPVVSLTVQQEGQTLIMRAVDAQLEGLGVVDDFALSLESVLEASSTGLKGIATLGVEVSQPPLLKLIPRKVLESTGESILNGILLTIKGRVGRQLVEDFQHWCNTQAAA